MSNLNELINHLYEEVVEQSNEAGAQSLSDERTKESDVDAQRLRLALSQMSETLQKDDLEDLLDPSPLDGESAMRLVMQWDSLCNSIDGLKRHIEELDSDITKMHPWGDFDVMKLEELKQNGCHVGFWSMPIAAFASQATEAWIIDYQATLISQDMTDAYFITISLEGEELTMPQQAQRIEICPCPVSTLIMLQTRDKDSLKRVQTLLGDFALAHYPELLATFRSMTSEDFTPPQHQHRHTQNLRIKLRKLFKKS